MTSPPESLPLQELRAHRVRCWRCREGMGCTPAVGLARRWLTHEATLRGIVLPAPRRRPPI